MRSNQSLFPPREAKRLLTSFTSALCLVALLAMPELAMAGGGFEDDACEFVGNISNLLTIASVAVVTIAIIFAGYQIAFAHKRISDVAPILIGGLLIGAAGQLAQWLLGRGENVEDCTSAAGGGMALLMELSKYVG